MENLIDIDRAIDKNRKVTISKIEGWSVYYETIFGEEFPVYFWEIPINKPNKTLLAIVFKSSMQRYNDYLKRKI